ncbi:MAG: sugar kinase [Chloroflexota bacterium]
MPEVVTLGECMAVLYPPEPVEIERSRTLLLDIGGAEANLAIRMRRLGHAARFISRVGDDPFGRRILNGLEEHGVDTVFVTIDPTNPTGVYFREWRPDGARKVYYYRAGSAACALTPADVPPEAFTGARIVHLTGITPALSPGCAATVTRAIELAHLAGAQVSFDPNYRPRLWDESEARDALLPLISQIDILLMGHEDARAIFGTVEAEASMEQAASLGPKIVVLKQAERGACALFGGRFVQVQAHPVEKVVDPVGAGDAFDAGFLAGLLREYDLEAALNFGARLGAAAVGTLGDYAGD